MLPYYEYVGYTGMVYLTLACVGLAARRVLFRNHDSIVGASLPSALLGLVVVQVLSWTLVTVFDAGIGRVMFALVAVCVVGTVWNLRKTLSLRPNFRELSRVAIAPTASLVLACVQWRHLLGAGSLNVASTNGDVVAYGNVGLHLINHGLSDAGNIGAANLGLLAETDVFGGYVLVALNRVLINGSIQQMFLPALTIAVMMVAHALFMLLRRHTTMSVEGAVIISVVPQSTFMFTYLMGNYFLAQIIGSALMIAMFSLLLSMSSGRITIRSEWARTTLLLALVIAGMLLSYPHMTFVVVPLLCIVVLASHRIRSPLQLVYGIVVAVVGGFLIVPTRASHSVSRFLALANDSINGWPLPGLLPIQMMGFQTSEYQETTVAMWIWSIALLALFVCNYLLWRKRVIHRLPIFWGSLLLLGTYVYVYVGSGPSYRQWKWLTFFSPLLIALILSGPVLWTASRTRHAKKLFSFIMALMLLLIASNVGKANTYMRAIGSIAVKPTSEMVELSERLKEQDLTELNVRLGPFLESMWPALFLDPIQVNIIDPSYYTVGTPAVAPTLVRKDAPLLNGVSSRLITSSYRLVEYPLGPVSVNTSGLASELNCPGTPIVAYPGDVISLTVTVRNTGTTTWLGSGTFPGSVNLGLRDISISGHKKELTRADLLPFPNYVSPGVEFGTSIELVMEEPGDFQIEVSPVVENVGWFADLDEANSCVLRLRVN